MPDAARPRCTVRVAGNPQHVYQVVAGFAMLASRREIDFAYDLVPAADAPFGHANVVTATITGRPVAYDMLDGYVNIPRSELERALGSVDLYFKRSFSRAENASLVHGDRIRPFGLNYPVTYRAAVFRRMRAGDPLRQRLVRGLKSAAGRSPHPHVETFESPPQVRDDPRVVFQTRVYDPEGEPGEDPALLARENAGAERRQLNEMRVGCVRSLREAFGESFVGGVAPTAFAASQYPDCLLDPAEVSRPRYLRALKDADVGVATVGLHQSNQWKLAEYVAASKAVVAERLRYEVPAFSSPANYLSFDTAGECVEQVAALLADPGRRLAMMEANRQHYEAYVRPDSAIRRTIREILEDDRT
ncbi:MAG: glycosyltransferase family 1 protein [Actinomycetota bacterium]|nr:glycosyltransferase family 1 protein [Actinomycetota bacterium]